MTLKSSNPFERNMHGMRPVSKGLNSRAKTSRGGMARYNSVAKPNANVSSHAQHSPLSSTSSSTKSVQSNTPLTPKSIPSITSSQSASNSPAPGLRRHIPIVAAAASASSAAESAKVRALESEVLALKAKLAESEAFQVEHCALRTSYECSVAANERLKSEMATVKMRLAKKEAECKALEAALLCVARTSEAMAKQKRKEQEQEKEMEREKTKEGEKRGYRDWRYDEVFRWMVSIDGGYFEKYEVIYERLKMLNIDGRCLEKMNEAVIGRIGVSEFQDKLYLMQHIQDLINEANQAHIQ